jgi:predicted ester cyclase
MSLFAMTAAKLGGKPRACQGPGFFAWFATPGWRTMPAKPMTNAPRLPRAISSLFPLSPVLCLGLAAACGGEPPPVQAPPPPPPPAVTTPPPVTAEAPPAPPPRKTTAELQQAASRALNETFASNDPGKYAGLFAESGVLKSAGQSDAVGRDAIKKAIGFFTTAFSKAKLAESRVFIKGDVAVTEWVITATHSGDLKGFKGTEKPVGVQGASILWFTPEGLIKEEHDYSNFSTILSQTGITKDKGRPVAALPGSPEVVNAKDTPEEKANVELIEKLNKSWDAKKADEVASAFTDDATWDDFTLPAPSKGKKDIKKYVTTFFTAVPDGKLTTANAWGFGDWVVEEGTFGGTQKGALFGLAPTNKPFTIHEITIAKVGPDKKIVQAASYGNDVELLTQLDPKSLPKPPAPKPEKADKPTTPAKPDAAKPDAPKK